MPEGMAYNPYFPDGNISMPQQLFQDSVEYEDGGFGCTNWSPPVKTRSNYSTFTHVIHAGTNASVSQMAKDVCTFLRWTSGNDRHLLAALLRLLLPLSPFRALP